MTSIDIVDLLTIILVLVDDWYIAKGHEFMQGKPGVKPEFRDSEILTLLVAQDFIPYPGETQFVAYIRANHGREFPKLVDQSQYNRRARQLWHLLEALRQEWVGLLGASTDKQWWLDTKPVPVLGYTRSKRRSDFAGRAAYGYCAARKLHYFGYKLVMLTTLKGVPVVYDLVPANLDERQAAEAVICRVSDCDIFSDKAFWAMTGKPVFVNAPAIASGLPNGLTRVNKTLSPLTNCSSEFVSASRLHFTKSKTPGVIWNACWLKPFMVYTLVSLPNSLL